MGAPIRGVDWKQVRLECEAGLEPISEIAFKHKLNRSTLSQRATRERWATPHRVVGLQQKASEADIQRLKSQVCHLGNPAHRDTIFTNPEEYQRIVAEYASKAVCQALPHVKRPNNWKEVSTADTVARRSMGLDKDKITAMTMVRVNGADGPVDIGVGVSLENEEPD